MGCGRAELLFPFHQVLCAFQHFFKPAANPVLLVGFLRDTVDGDDQTLQARFDYFPCRLVVEVMGVGGGGGIYFFTDGIFYHFQKAGVKEWLALEIKGKPGRMPVHLVNDGLKKVLVKHAGRTRESTQAAGAFGTAEVAGSGGFHTHGHGHTPQ